jgi:hypothetical protein
MKIFAVALIILAASTVYATDLTTGHPLEVTKLGTSGSALEFTEWVIPPKSCNHFYIENSQFQTIVDLDCHGHVVVKKGDNDKAARAFWKAVQRLGYRLTKCK